MAIDAPLRLCTHGCAVRHYENCPDCFGFGFKEGGEILSAWRAEESKKYSLAFKECMACGGTPSGTTR